MNTCVIVGKILRKPEFISSVQGSDAYLIVESCRAYPESDGHYVKDRFKVVLWHGIAEECKAICKEGDLIAIRGRVESLEKEENEKYHYECKIVAEHVSLPACF